MNIDKEYCMSSFLAYRYILDDDKEFFAHTHHRNYELISPDERIRVSTALEIDSAIKKQVETHKNEKLGILLSGGMDSAILASYMKGCHAYTFRFGGWQSEEVERAKKFADYYGLELHYVDISWETIEPLVDLVMKQKGAPVHSIEPQIVQAALQAKEDGIERIVIGDAADYIFGGMDKLLSKDWLYEEFIQRYIYINPQDVLVKPTNVFSVFEDYKLGEAIDFVSFMDKYAAIESYGSYENAFRAAGMPYSDWYEKMMLAEPLDLQRIRSGESKYLIRELFKMKYPELPVPTKNPMPRPVDFYFQDWGGPQRPEFKNGIDMKQFTGNQKWLMWCLERFLNMNEN